MNKTLLTVGNVYLDHNIFGIKAGQHYRLESGKDYFGTTGERVLGGSAINVALQARQLGLEVGFIGKTGSDEAGREVRNLLEAEAIHAELVHEDAALTTSMAVNLVSESGEFIGLHYGNASKTLVASDIDFDSPLLSRAHGIYFGGTAKQPLLFKACETVFAKLAERGIKVFFDPNRFPAEECEVDKSLLHAQLAYVEGYFPNEEELLQATGKASVDEALAEVLDTGVTFVALKLGPKGCRVATKDDDFVVAGHKVKPQTTVGAGDCFNATFMAYYLQGCELRVCAEKATAAAAIKVGQNIWPNQAELDEAK